MTDVEEIEWWDAEDADEFASSVAGDIGFIIESALDARGSAVLAFPGGSTPRPIFEKLLEKDIKWKYVTIIPTDDRLVPVDDDLSNVKMLAQYFMTRGARVMPLAPDLDDYKAAGAAADARLQDMPWPLDLVWLGMGSDGHTASIFPGPDLDEALNGPTERRACGVMPDPMPKDAPVARVTLTKAAICEARTVLVTITGDEKKKVLEEAIDAGASARAPIGRLTSELTVPIDIHWLK